MKSDRLVFQPDTPSELRDCTAERRCCNYDVLGAVQRVLLQRQLYRWVAMTHTYRIYLLLVATLATLVWQQAAAAKYPDTHTLPAKSKVSDPLFVHKQWKVNPSDGLLTVVVPVYPSDLELGNLRNQLRTAAQYFDINTVKEYILSAPWDKVARLQEFVDQEWAIDFPKYHGAARVISDGDCASQLVEGTTYDKDPLKYPGWVKQQLVSPQQTEQSHRVDMLRDIAVTLRQMSLQLAAVVLSMSFPAKLTSARQMHTAYASCHSCFPSLRVAHALLMFTNMLTDADHSCMQPLKLPFGKAVSLLPCSHRSRELLHTSLMPFR